MAKMAKFLNLEEGVVGIAFGYYPTEWVNICRDAPDVVHRAMHTLLKTLKTRPNLSLASHRGKTLSA